MGVIKAFTGAIGGAFADQWKDLNMDWCMLFYIRMIIKEKGMK